MTAPPDDPTTPVAPPADSADSVPEVSETDMWAAELAFMPEGDKSVRQAQFAIRTAVRAQALAKLAGTDPVDELLDARAGTCSPSSRKVYETAIAYLKRERELRYALRWYLPN